MTKVTSTHKKNNGFSAMGCIANSDRVCRVNGKWEGGFQKGTVRDRKKTEHRETDERQGQKRREKGSILCQGAGYGQSREMRGRVKDRD